MEQGDSSGLRINKEKSSILIFNSKDRPEIINGIKVTDGIRYLGMTVTNKKKCFKAHRISNIEKERRLANTTYSVLSQSCNKILIRKTFLERHMPTSNIICVRHPRLNKN